MKPLVNIVLLVILVITIGAYALFKNGWVIFIGFWTMALFLFCYGNNRWSRGDKIDNIEHPNPPELAPYHNESK
jgi:CHASE2 domain-containing sensor protein